MSTQRLPIVGWRVFQLVALAALAWATWRLLGTTPYRIDIDVYRMGGRAWLDGAPLYADGVMFTTEAGLDLPFTYPPLAAVAFAPFALLSLPAASIAITVTTLLLLLASTWIVLTRLRVAQRWPLPDGAGWRRASLAAAIVALAVLYFEPVQANFEFGQINVVLMTLVIADCVPRKTPWPRGLLLGLAMALKLTPAVFLLYFLLRRDTRTLITAVVSAAVATLVGMAFAWRDSLQYWTETVHDTDRIGTVSFNTNQNIAGWLARLGVAEGPRFVLWTIACFAVLGLTVWAGRRVLKADQPMLALICVALFGLVVSPVSWSHHWVWALPAVLVTAVIAYRQRSAALGVVSAIGVVLMVVMPYALLPEHEESAAPVWRQLIGGPYLWWALATIAVTGAVATKLVPKGDEQLSTSVDASAPVVATG
ncbi:glycosyltransferase 87 family protein [Mycolicibacterium arenosum]|uniref:Glycosyltransferase 87 family protein n=1 Tax=Mycolicibacterium arenosum TaxID=2952157 RepID=A0ABT1MD18_9MYCO|nr:glycosyltransferase 87 family protein [Mycolicibacterium sp. CAU 1645]MCP9276450.1 glycosyltransferase 87 family protein [Mycolicibacterium sp. CAU 1645]